MVQVKRVECEVLVIGSGGAGLRAAIELHDRDINVVVVGKCEKRDAHYRHDFPKLSPQWKVNVYCETKRNKIIVFKKPVPPVSVEIAKLVKQPKPTVHLLE